MLKTENNVDIAVVEVGIRERLDKNHPKRRRSDICCSDSWHRKENKKVCVGISKRGSFSTSYSFSGKCRRQGGNCVVAIDGPHHPSRSYFFSQMSQLPPPQLVKIFLPCVSSPLQTLLRLYGPHQLHNPGTSFTVINALTRLTERC